MRALPLLSSLVVLGCAARSAPIETEGALGRVVVYRNGVAYFERTAPVEDGVLELRVPAHRVDDLLKSLTVVDAATNTPAPIAYPTRPPTTDESAPVTLRIRVPADDGQRMLLRYVTEAPSWKPTYRVVLGERGKVRLLGWAIVDNTSGEDWESVRLGVGSSSALSFRHDLSTVRNVRREELRAAESVASAPPVGESLLPDSGVIGSIDDAAIARLPPAEQVRGQDKKPNVSFRSGISLKKRDSSNEGGGDPDAPTDIRGSYYQMLDAIPDSPLARAAAMSSSRAVVIEGFAARADRDPGQAALSRALRVREQLVAMGARPEDLTAVANLEIKSDAGGVRLVFAPGAEAAAAKPAGHVLEAVGTSHFESKLPISIPAGDSAMVAIVNHETPGEVVYLYDAESLHGNREYAFRALKIANPVSSTLESGPVTVYSEGRFVGEGFVDPIPGGATTFLPFALDRLVVVEQSRDEVDRISRIVTVQRGVVSAEVRHAKRRKLTVSNRGTEAATIYVRHTPARGFSMVPMDASGEKVGDAHLVRVVVPAGGKREVVIEEVAPALKSVDLHTESGLAMLAAFASGAGAAGELGRRVEHAVRLRRELGALDEELETARGRLEELRRRSSDLAEQVASLRTARSGAAVLRVLETKLVETTNDLAKASSATLGLEDRRNVARVKLEDALAEISP